MAIAYDPSRKTFYLEGDRFSYIFRVNEYGYLQQMHYGAKIGREDISYAAFQFWRGFAPAFPGAKNDWDSLDTMAAEYPGYGRGDFRRGALLTVDNQGRRTEDLKYRSHVIVREKPALTGMPSLRGGESLIVFLRSRTLDVELYYTVYERENALARRAVIKNRLDGDVRIQRVCALSLDLPDADYDMITLYGKYGGEGQIERVPLRHGLQTVYSCRGASSHQYNPFMALARKNADEHTGEAIGVSYIYSGNFEISAERTQFETVRVLAGFPSADFRYTVARGECFHTPEAVTVYSDAGLGRMSRAFHDLFRDRLINPVFAHTPRPVVFNSWESMGFDFDTEKLFAAIDACKDTGIELFVLDDGWFGKRDDDTRGLGDWRVNTKKLCGGLPPIIERCKVNGLKFGLWFEPEMVNPDSDLYRAHPDWCLRVPDVEPCLCRNQLVLDLTRSEVVEYLQNSVSSILQDNDIAYVKWDMNRHITDAYSAALPPDRQQEVCHRYILGLYELIGRLTEQFPHVLFEGCSGGGGRIDPGMLAYFPQHWASDNSDAIDRTRIQYGLSLCYPLSALTGHVSAVPNNQVGRVTPFATRGIVASNVSFGYELDLTDLSEEERNLMKRQIGDYKRIAPLIANGDLYRLKDPFTGNDFVFEIVSKDKNEAVVSFVQILGVFSVPIRRLRLQGLDEHKTYFVEETGLTLSGKTLMGLGLIMPCERGDFQAAVYHLTSKA